MRYILIVAAACLIGAVGGYFHGYVYAINSNPLWVAINKSNEENGEFIKQLNQTIKETDWCEAGRAALKGQQHDK